MGAELDDVNSKIIFKTKFRSALAHREADAPGAPQPAEVAMEPRRPRTSYGPSVGASSPLRPPEAWDLLPLGSSPACRHFVPHLRSRLFKRGAIWAPAKSSPGPRLLHGAYLDLRRWPRPESSGTLGGTHTTWHPLRLHLPPDTSGAEGS